MKNIYLIVLILFTISSFAQKVKKAKGKLTYGTEKYYVLKSDMKTKHGEYKIVSYTPPFRKLELGEFINGKKEGIWIKWYDKKGGKIKSKGQYNNDEKFGIWYYYYSNGKLIQEYDFDNSKIISSTECDTDKKYSVNKSNEITEIILDCPPTRIGGIRIMVSELYNEIMKKSPFKVNESGRTNIKINETLSFYVTEKGTIENINYSGKEKNTELDQLIREFIERDYHKWIAGTLNTEKVNAKIDIPIRINIMY